MPYLFKGKSVLNNALMSSKQILEQLNANQLSDEQKISLAIDPKQSHYATVTVRGKQYQGFVCHACGSGLCFDQEGGVTYNDRLLKSSHKDATVTCTKIQKF